MKRKKKAELLIRVDNAAFRKEVLEADIPVLVDFTAPWCSSSEEVEAAMKELAQEFAGLIKIAQIDIDKNVDVASQLGVHALPALLLFYRGRELGRAKVANKAMLCLLYTSPSPRD